MSNSELSILDHLKELRKRLFHIVLWILMGSISGFYIYDIFINYLIVPFQNSIHSELGKELFVQSLFEGFITKFKVSFIIGGFMASPAIIYHILRFIFPAIGKKEKIAIIFGLFISVLLASSSVYLTFFKLIPFILTFMTSAGFIPENVGLILNFQNSIFYVIQFVIFSMITFQFPILLEIGLAFNLVTRKQLLKKSKFIIIGIFVLSALITPPDFVSQLAISLPLITLFFITILIAKCFGWGKQCLD